jgi:hypothetical protein
MRTRLWILFAAAVGCAHARSSSPTTTERALAERMEAIAYQGTASARCGDVTLPRTSPGPGRAESVTWWAEVLAMVECAGRVGDSGTRLLLAPWLGRPTGGGFKPFGT